MTSQAKQQISKTDLEYLLQIHLGPSIHVASYKTRPLTEPGENYGSTMLAVDVTLQPDGVQLSLVAKLVPPTDFLRKVFNVPVTFLKEINMYKLVDPAFAKFQVEQGVLEEKLVCLFPECFGVRANVMDDFEKEADEGALILLDNLKSQGYYMGNRTQGLSLKHAQIAISKLACFHAMPIALKFLKPEIFKEVILKTCAPSKMGIDDIDKWIQVTIENLMTMSEVVPYINTIRGRLVENFAELMGVTEPYIKEPFATMLHCDFWVNNMMFKSQNEQETPTDCKFVDFQCTCYNSPVKDLIFFLYTSLAENLRKHYNDLIDLYYNDFISCLKSLKCDTKLFSYDHFLEEIKAFAPREFGHILFMLGVVNAERHQVSDLCDVSDETFQKQSLATNLNYNRKMKDFILDFIEKGWL